MHWSVLPHEHWIGVYTGNHRRHLLPSPIFQLRSSLLVTGVLAVGRVVNNQFQFCTQVLNPQLDNWGGKIQIPVCKWMSHLNVPPKMKMGSNSIFKPQPVGWRGWRTACQPPKISELWTFHAQCRNILLHLHCFTSGIAGRRAGLGLNSMWQCVFHTPPLRWSMVQTYNTMSFIVATSTELHEKKTDW